MLQQAAYIAVMVILIVAGVAIFVDSFARITRGDLSAVKAEAISQFDVWLASHAAAQLGLSPGNCEVVQESETVGQNRSGAIYSYTLTRFLRNQNGQYILFKSTPRGPYVKVVAPKVAKATLKGANVPPAAG